MDAPSILKEDRIGDDFVLRFGNFVIDTQRGSRALLLPPHAPPKQTSSVPRSATSFPEPSCWNPAPLRNFSKEARDSHGPPSNPVYPSFPGSHCCEPSPVENLSVDARDSHAPVEKSVFSFLDSPSFQESNEPPPPEKSVFSFLDSPSFQESNEPLEAATAPLYPTEIWAPQYFPAPLYPTDNVYLNEALPWIFQLMTDQPITFENLLESCSAHHLYVILEKFWSEKDTFLHAALIENGSRSLQSFVKKLAGTGLEQYFTLMIAGSAYEFMSEKHAWHVVEACFKTFANQTNESLYRYVLQHFQRLSTRQFGSPTINAMMNTVGGDLLDALLRLVEKYACQLAFDPFGNHVVQHCLSELRYEEVNHRIVCALKGSFVELAQKQYGSYVVQDCIRYSNDAGRGLVLGDIFENDRTLLMLAKNDFGNYPVQMALIVTWIRDRPMYEKLVRVLQPRFAKLIQRAHEELQKLLTPRQQQGKPQIGFQSSKKTFNGRSECLSIYK